MLEEVLNIKKNEDDDQPNQRSLKKEDKKLKENPPVAKPATAQSVEEKPADKLDLGDPKLNEVADQLIAIGKAIEHQKIEVAVTVNGVRKANKELVLRLAKILKEIDEKEEAEKKEEKEKESFWYRLFKKIFLAQAGGAKNANAMEAKDAKDAKNKGKWGSLGGFDSVNAVSAELERAVARLQSASKVDSDMNDLTVLQDMTEVMKLSSQLSGKMPSFSVQPNPMVERALMSVASISVDMKNNAASTTLGSLSSQGLKVATESLESSTELHMNEKTGNVNSMIDSLQKAQAEVVVPSSVPMTAEAKQRKAQENANFVNPSTYGTEPK